MMKKVFAILLAIMFIFSLTCPSISAVEKAPVKKKTKVVKKVVKKKKARVYRTGARPVFPVDTGSAVKKEEVKKVDVKVVPKPAPKLEPQARGGWFAEGGYGAGSLVIEGGYGRLELMKKISYSAGAGLAIGNGFSVVILDLARITYDMEKYYVGGGMNYAMYSTPNVQNVPGLSSGKIPSQNMLGIELLGGMRVADKISARVGFSTALGIRASVSYEF